MTLPRFQPMLAENRPHRVPVGRWKFEPKLDGWRTLLYLDDGEVTVRTRTGRDITAHTPELSSMAAAVGRRCVLDGELVVGAGLPGDFYRVAPRLAMRAEWATRAKSVTFVAFDVLWIDDRPTVALAYRDRRDQLEDLAVLGPAWTTVPAFDDDPHAVMAAVESLGLEGLVAKRVESRYQPGRRSTDWLKLKTDQWRRIHAPRRHDQPSPAADRS